MVIAGFAFAGIAAIIHLYIFFLESIAWTGERARATFGTTVQEAETTKALAFNQGFYNLFLAVTVFVGIIVFAAGAQIAGAALVFAGAGCMFAAGLVLLISSPSKVAAAAKQLVPPLLGIVLLAIGLVL